MTGALRLVRALVLVLVVAGGGAQARTFLLDRASGGAVVRAELNAEERPTIALGASQQVRVAVGSERVPASRVLEVPLDLPWPVSHRPLAVEAIVLVAGAGRTVRAPIERGRTPRARLHFEASEVGRVVAYSLTATQAARVGARSRLLAPVAIPAGGGRLRFALGRGDEACATGFDVRVGVDVVAGGRGRPLWRRTLSGSEACGDWLEQEIDVPHVAPRARLRFRARPLGPDGGARAAGVLIADPMLDGREPDGGEALNVILVSLDTLGTRHLGTYGYPYPTSRELDARVERGTVFEHAVTTYPSTAASHMSMFTGRLPHRHGVRGVFDRLPRHLWTLPQLMRAAGYLTVAVTENATLSRSMGFARGFHRYRENRGRMLETPGLAEETFGWATRWLETQRREPFFLFVHTYEVHSPYEPTEADLALVRPADVGGEPDKQWRHDAEIRAVDRMLARFHDLLVERGLLERTLLVVTADHGEAFGEHGQWAHGTALYDEVMHVPLVMWGRGVPAGVRIAERVSLVDVTPTILEMAGVPATVLEHTDTPRTTVEGRSLVPLLHGGSVASEPLVAELRGGLVPKDEEDTDLRAVWLGRHKVIHDRVRDAWEVYDLAADPEELHDLAADEAALIARAKQVLADYEARGITPERDAGRAAADAPLDAGAVERLRALGYLD